ncbi:hypothetical protein ACGIF2_10390 [Cellulomonas sp. P22]|uniref:hypothetical protein n=1 Tax=Cellulomonas sp. P22 TaxID=3373189 RepID=UPI00379235F3
MNRPAPGVVVSGGYGGTTARLEDLHHAATALENAARRLDDAAQKLAAAAHATWLGDEALGTGRAARTSLAPLLAGAGAPGETAEVLRSLSRSLRAAAAGYEDAESTATRVVRGLVGVGAARVGELPPLLAVAVAWGITGPMVSSAGLAVVANFALTGRRPDPTDLVRGGAAEVLLHGVASYLRGLRSGFRPWTPTPSGGAVRPVAVALGLRSMAVTPRLPGRELRGDEVPHDDADLLRLVGATYPSGLEAGTGAPGAVSVLRFDHPDGTRSWAVAIPGTQDAGVSGSNPMDMGSNLRLIAGLPDSTSDLVTQALTQAGARPDEPVLLAGHSQGGMAAVAVAASAVATGSFAVTHVLTAGSPVAGMAAPGVTMKHLEHTTDAIPVTDGWHVPDTPERTTVAVDLRTSADPADRLASRDLVASHAIDGYVRSAERVEELSASDPSLSAWDTSEQRIFGPAGTTVHLQQYQGVRAPAAGEVAPGGLPPVPVVRPLSPAESAALGW